MDTTIPIELLLRLINATPEQRAVVGHLRGVPVDLGTVTAARPKFEFRKAGSHWDVIYDGSETFHLPDKLGAKYIGYWLHHANAPIAPFDLERVIQPEKAQVRARDSIQGQLDAEAIRQYLRQLDDLRGQRAEAAEDGDLATAERLDEDIEAIEAALKQPGQASDAGERARVNVNKAVTAVLRHLRKGEAAEQAFARHLEQFLSLGYECCYHQPPGISWGKNNL
jgi:hypothetical protein